jgi:hypothetical protein
MTNRYETELRLNFCGISLILIYVSEELVVPVDGGSWCAQIFRTRVPNYTMSHINAHRHKNFGLYKHN